ncbi:hypothetical protein V1478_016842 [Vespula squamosa]|uniref:Uncharacterized protein n=1 Tax=Vespula squamosa TaxID=30214 RepID=A0ABD2A0Z8_VESSQ
MFDKLKNNIIFLIRMIDKTKPLDSRLWLGSQCAHVTSHGRSLSVVASGGEWLSWFIHGKIIQRFASVENCIGPQLTQRSVTL